MMKFKPITPEEMIEVYDRFTAKTITKKEIWDMEVRASRNKQTRELRDLAHLFNGVR